MVSRKKAPARPPAGLTLAYERVGDVLTITPDRAIEVLNVAKLKAEVLERLGADAAPHVCFDLASVDFVDSSGIGVFVGIQARLKAAGRRLSFCGLNRNVTALFRVTQIEKIFTVFPTRAKVR